MKKVLSCLTGILVSMLCLTTNAQQTFFNKVYYDANDGISVFGADQSTDHGFVMVGKKHNGSGTMFKIDSTGQIEWARQLGSPGMSCELHDILCNTDSTIVTAGLLYRNSELKLSIIKWNSHGDSLWTKYFSGMEFADRVKISALANGGYLLSASIHGYYSMSGIRSLIIRLTEQGEILWSGTYTSTLYEITPMIARELPDGNLVIAGEARNVESYRSNAFVVKTDDNGIPVWSVIMQDTEESSYSSVHDVAVTVDGIIALAEAEYRVTLIKLDFSGQTVWSQSYTGAGYSMWTSFPGNIVPLTDGGFILSYPGYFGGTMIKTGNNGDPVWQQFVFMDLLKVMPTGDGGYITFGNGPIYGLKKVPDFIPHAGVYKTDSVGYNEYCIFPMIVELYNFSAMFSNLNIQNTQAGYSSSASVEISSFPVITEDTCVVFTGGLNDHSTIAKALTISPNPATSLISVDSGIPFSPGSTLEIINASGSVIRKIPFSSDPLPVAVSNLPNGIYLLRLISKQQYQTGKLIIKHQ